jgi:two-component system, response regulator YesN
LKYDTIEGNKALRFLVRIGEVWGMDKFSLEMQEHIKRNMKMYYHTTQIACVFIDEYGETVYAEGEEQSYCTKIKNVLKEDAPCTQSHLYASKQADELGEAYIFFCPSGLVHITVAIKNGQIFSGAIVVGPFLMSEPDRIEIDNLLKNHEISQNEKNRLVEDYASIPQISTTTIRYYLQLLTVLAKDIMMDTQNHMQKKKAFFDEQRLISESIQELKETDEVKLSQEKEYPLHLERELITRVIRGDEMGAKSILNELLGYVFFNHYGDNNRIIAMCIELIVVMSRAAVEGGARYEEVCKITHSIYEKAFNSVDIEVICMWLLDMLEKMILLIFPMTIDKKEQMAVIKKSIQYMNQHLRENLTLEQVAKHVNLSTTYFSRLFSGEMQTTFVEYLSMIRVEQSKIYLANEEYSISDIALMLGFSDQSYFSKVFKKIEGITPGKYRRMYL